MINLGQRIVDGAVLTGVLGAVLINCKPYDSLGCSIYSSFSQLYNYDEISRIGTQNSYPAYLDQVFLSDRNLISLGTVSRM